MRKLTLAALAVASFTLFAVQPASAQSRVSVGDGFRFGAGQAVAQRLVGGGFFGGAQFRQTFGFHAPLFQQQFGFRGGFYGGAQFRQPFIHGAAFRQQLFFRQSFYAVPQTLVVPQPVFVPQPVIVEQPQAFLQQPVQQAISACGTLGLGAGYGYSSLAFTGGCHGQAFVQPLRLRLGFRGY